QTPVIYTLSLHDALPISNRIFIYLFLHSLPCPRHHLAQGVSIDINVFPMGCVRCPNKASQIAKAIFSGHTLDVVRSRSYALPGMISKRKSATNLFCRAL